MNRAQAKREALWRASRVIEDAMTQGWPDPEIYEWSEADAARVRAGLREVIEELGRRGYGTTPPTS